MRLVFAIALCLGLLIAEDHILQLQQFRTSVLSLLSPIHRLAALPGETIDAIDEGLRSRRELMNDNARLAEENLQLRGRMQTYDSLRAENRRLRDLLGSSLSLPERILAAKLMQVDLDPYRQQVMLNRGESSGVFVGQPVLDADAVMGQVISASSMNSTVMLITDAAHMLPVQVNRNGLRTLAAGSGLIDQLKLPYLTKNADIRVGDLLVTSGLGGVFPAGYPVARVIEIRNRPENPFAEVIAKPTARLDRSQDVLLVWNLDPPEQFVGQVSEGEVASVLTEADVKSAAQTP